MYDAIYIITRIKYFIRYDVCDDLYSEATTIHLQRCANEPYSVHKTSILHEHKHADFITKTAFTIRFALEICKYVSCM